MTTAGGASLRADRTRVLGRDVFVVDVVMQADLECVEVEHVQRLPHLFDSGLVLFARAPVRHRLVPLGCTLGHRRRDMAKQGFSQSWNSVCRGELLAFDGINKVVAAAPNR